MTRGSKISALITCVVVLVLAAFVAVSDEWSGCHIANWSKGYLGVRDFPPGIVVSGSAEVKTIDFRRIRGVVEVCVIDMPYYEEPSFSTAMTERGFRHGRPMACWRNTEGKIIAVARSKDGSLMWEHIDMGEPVRWYRAGDKQCAEIGNAVLTCRDKFCEFSQ